MDRKEFLKLGCNTCVMGAAALFLGSLDSCSPGFPVFKTEVVNNQVAIPLPLFDKSSLQLVRPKGWQYDIAVQKNADGSYQALLMRCTHMDNQLSATQNDYSCSLHGSRFNKEGRVIKGPAERPLKKYQTSIANNQLNIFI